MKELNDIIQAYDRAVLQKKQTALVTVVKVDGSSYRRPGARMLVTDDGEVTGAISGGCLEGDALRKAQFAILQQQNKLEIYDTTFEEDNKLGVQLGCNGIVYILFEPIQKEEENNPIQLLKKVAQERKDAVIITAFNENKFAPQKGTCGYINDAHYYFDEKIKTPLQQCQTVLQQRTSMIDSHDNDCVLYQYIPPMLQLLIVGAGNDVQPLVEMAHLLGWRTIVTDGRATYATRQRFPKAGEVRVLKPATVLSACETDQQTAVLLMTHNYNYDMAALQQLLQTDCGYIGVLGPKKKLTKMIDELTENTGPIDGMKLKNIYGPVGLDIGSETAEEIALAIVAEIKSVFAVRNGSSLRDKAASIHSRNLVS